MQELDTSTLQPDIRKVLLMGPPGVGKTHFLKTMPKPVYVFSFDKGYLTLAGEPGIKVGICMDDNRYAPKAYAEFEQKFRSLCAGEKYKWADGKEEPYQTIALDNVSFLSTAIFDHQQKVNSNIDKPGGYLVYGQVRSKLQDILAKTVVIANYVVFTTLIEAEKDETTGEIFFLPTVVGKISREMGAWFDAVFYLTVDKSPQGTKQYKLLTVGDRRQQAKIRIPSSLGRVVQPVEEPDFGALMKKINSAISTQGVK